MMSVLLAVAVCCVALGNTAPILEDEERVNVQLIRHHSDDRVRRDAGASSMPDVIVMRFNLRGDDVILRLKRVRYPPMYVLGSEGAREVTGLDHSGSCVYVDPSRQAAFTVSTSDGEFTLDGNWRHGDDHLEMKPAGRVRRDVHDDVIRDADDDVTRDADDDVTLDADNDDVNTHIVTNASPMAINYGHDDRHTADSDTVDDSGEGGRRRKRQTTTVTQHTVETSFIVDHTDFAAFQTDFPTDTMKKINDYYTLIGHTLNNIYASVVEVDPTIDIKVPIIALYIVESAANAITVSTGQLTGEMYLDDLIAWIPQQTMLPPSDHYMAFTRYDVFIQAPLTEANQAVGVANVGQVCDARGVSVVETDPLTSSVSNVAAHELGHSLNGQHDGEAGNDPDASACPGEDQNIMSATMRINVDGIPPRNIFRFSACSVEAFKSYLSGETCTLPASTSVTTAALALPFTDYSSDLVTDRDSQCRLALKDPNSGYCDPVPFGKTEGDICFGMLCTKPSAPNTISCGYVLPYDGTPCGTGKICYLGLCEDAAAVQQIAQTFDSATDAPATDAPATDAPATDAPATDAPATDAPATDAPATDAPATDAPATDAPATDAPATDAPATDAPSTAAPATDAPATDAPATDAPATDAPATDAPATDAPATDAPATDAPATDAPATDAPATDAPATDAPATDAPATDAPATDAPATDAPATDAPATDAPATDAPATDAPATDAPATDAPATDAPATDAPATDAPATDAPATDAPATDAPATDAPATDAPATDAPATDAPATDAPATDAPATDAPATDAPATDAPATDAPATDAPATDAPATDAPTTTDLPTDAANEATTMAPTTPAPLPLCTRSCSRIYRWCRWYNWWSRLTGRPLHPCCATPCQRPRTYRRHRYDE